MKHKIQILLVAVICLFNISSFTVKALEGSLAVSKVQSCKSIDGGAASGCEDNIVIGLPYLLVTGSGFNDTSTITVADITGIYPSQFSTTMLLASMPGGDFSKNLSAAAVSVQNGSTSSSPITVSIRCTDAQKDNCIQGNPFPSITPSPSGAPNPSGATPSTAPPNPSVPKIQNDLSSECAKQGLQYDDVSGLCLPANPYKANADSLAGQVTLGGLIKRILNILLTLAGVIAVLMIVLGGYQYVTSQGVDDKAKAGRKTITNAAIGLIAVLLAYMLVTVVTNFVTQGTIL
ncbi:MAG: hypothetical protein KBD66_03910 [Candidatus Doudnabacteria bacterium]|nr:hypothetical protein [Candidatus Doudnabacteria bacterium]